jgi:hypothetical protein
VAELAEAGGSNTVARFQKVVVRPSGFEAHVRRNACDVLKEETIVDDLCHGGAILSYDEA